MATPDNFAFLDATAQAELVRQKEVQPIELVEAAIARIEQLNPALNAVITPMYEPARAAAVEKQPDGPFAGVPFLLKDILGAYAGVRMTLGSKLLQDFVPDHDSELVARFKRAGLIVVGKTNRPEFGILPRLSRCSSVPAAIPGIPTIRRAAPVADPLQRLPRGWYPWPMAMTVAGPFAFRLPAAVCSGSSRPGPAIPWGLILAMS